MRLMPWGFRAAVLMALVFAVATVARLSSEKSPLREVFGEFELPAVSAASLLASVWIRHSWRTGAQAGAPSGRPPTTAAGFHRLGRDLEFDPSTQFDPDCGLISPPETPLEAQSLAQRIGVRLSHLVLPLHGHAEMARLSVEATHPACADLIEVDRAAARIALLSETLLIFSGVPGHGGRPVDLAEFMRLLEEDVRRVLQLETRLQISYDTTGARVWMDPRLTRLALLQLVCNAEDAKPDEALVAVQVRGRSLRIVDEGQGMAEADWQSLEAPLQVLKDPERGVGLGLLVARTAMDMQKGSLHVDYSGPSGTAVSLILPLADPA